MVTNEPIIPDDLFNSAIVPDVIPTPSEVAWVFGFHFGCDIQYAKYFGNETKRLDGEISKVSNVKEIVTPGHEGVSVNGFIHPYTLLLTPLHKILEEHIRQVCKIYEFNPKYIWYDNGTAYASEKRKRATRHLFYPYGESIIFEMNNYCWDNGLSYDGSESNSNRFDVLLILARLGYAVPLYFGFDHPANGKNAIELRLAFDKTLLS